MFGDIFELEFGQHVTVDGEVWVVIKTFLNGLDRFHLAVRGTDKLPCQAFLIKGEPLPPLTKVPPLPGLKIG